MENRKLERFGRYLILDHLQDGGMAIISRAFFLGEKFGKLVVIKQIKESFSDDEDFVTMFLDEIKITFELGHPNIAQTFDYGKLNNRLFLVMEYIDGKSLRDLLDRLAISSTKLPISAAIYLISQVCLGLSYAHLYKNKLTGENANIVHRDISPENIMISYDGIVKVIDFGIAKADSNSRKTKAGAIKGKFSYFAPEYIQGLPIDSRYDIFSLGLVLWEILCMRAHFEKDEENPFAILAKIEKCEITPPSKFAPAVPAELERIIIKALQKNIKKRYQTIEEFGQDLTSFLYSFDPTFSISQFREEIQKIFKSDMKEDSATLMEYGNIKTEKYYQEYKAEIEKNTKDDPDAKKTVIAHNGATLVSSSFKRPKFNNQPKKDQGPDLSKFDRHSSERFVNTDPSDADDSPPLYRQLKLFSALLVFLILSLWITNKIIPFYGIYAKQMNYKGTVSLNDFKNKEVQLFLNETLIPSNTKSVEIPIYETVYFRFVKNGFDPFITSIMLTDKEEKTTLLSPKFTKSPSGIVECEDKDFPPNSILRIKMPNNEAPYIIKLPFNKLSLPEGNYVAIFNEQRIDFTVGRDVIQKIKILKMSNPKEK